MAYDHPIVQCRNLDDIGPGLISGVQCNWAFCGKIIFYLYFTDVLFWFVCVHGVFEFGETMSSIYYLHNEDFIFGIYFQAHMCCVYIYDIINVYYRSCKSFLTIVLNLSPFSFLYVVLHLRSKIALPKCPTENHRTIIKAQFKHKTQ